MTLSIDVPNYEERRTSIDIIVLVASRTADITNCVRDQRRIPRDKQVSDVVRGIIRDFEDLRANNHIRVVLRRERSRQTIQDARPVRRPSSTPNAIQSCHQLRRLGKMRTRTEHPIHRRRSSRRREPCPSRRSRRRTRIRTRSRSASKTRLDSGAPRASGSAHSPASSTKRFSKSHWSAKCSHRSRAHLRSRPRAIASPASEQATNAARAPVSSSPGPNHSSRNTGYVTAIVIAAPMIMPVNTVQHVRPHMTKI